MKEKLKVYLAGAMEFVSDGGVGWRETLTPVLEKMGFEVINPVLQENTEFPPQIKEAKLFDLSTYRVAMRELIIDRDLALIKTCAFVICYWDGKGGGTYGEITYAYLNNIPVYLVEVTRRPQTSSWALGCSTELFTNFSDLESFLNGQRKEATEK